MDLEDITLSDTSQTQRTNAVWFLLYEVPGVVKFMETESRTVGTRGWWGAERESVPRGQFQFGRVSKSWGRMVVTAAQHCECA